MKTVILLLFLPLLVNAQYDSYGEELSIQDISADTLTVRGEHFGIDSGPTLEFRWEVHKEGQLYGTFVGAEGNPFLRVLLPAGDYRIVRYTYYFTEGKVSGITESQELLLSFNARKASGDPAQLPTVRPTLTAGNLP